MALLIGGRSLGQDLGGFLPGGGGGLLGPGGGTGGFGNPGTISIGVPIGGSSGSSGGSGGGGGGGGYATPANWYTAAASALLGLDWGRIAAFLLGLILIAGGIFLIKTVRQTVVVGAKHVGRAVAESGEAAA